MSRGLAATYLLLQAAGVTGWWILMAVSPDARSLFMIRDAPFAALAAFAPGDMIVIALGSALAGVKRSVALAWIVTGAMIYGALYCATAFFLQASPPWGAMLMIPAAIASALAAGTISRNARS